MRVIKVVILGHVALALLIIENAASNGVDWCCKRIGIQRWEL